MNEIKEYDVPQELVDIINDSIAMDNLKRVYTKLPFSFKKAVKCAKEAQRQKNKFWNCIYKIYPEEEEEVIDYIPHSQKIRIKKK